MGTKVSWTFITVSSKRVVWALVIVRNVNLISAVFNVNDYVSLVKNSIAKYTNISNCLVCGQADDFSWSP